MKKILLMVAAMAVVVFTSCSNENDGDSGKEKTRLSVKISGVVKSRAIEAPGSTASGTIQLANGRIFVINPLDNVTDSQELDVTEAMTTGQTLTNQVPSDSRVYIIGNIPADDQTRISGLKTFSEIKAATSAISTQSNYTLAALANTSGMPAGITVNGAAATVNVSINPLISRMELTQVKAKTAAEALIELQLQEPGATSAPFITEFKVTGVYVDGYASLFTYNGGLSGAAHSQGMSKEFAGVLGDTGNWNAASSPVIATPGNGDVWAHNLPAGSLPRFIIKLEGVKYNNGSGTVIDQTDKTYYLTVKSYSDGLTVFTRGKIYRVGSGDGISFGVGDLGLVPNPGSVGLTVKVQIQEWELVEPDAVLG